jgi:superfamily II DNA or RNA helicase
MPHAQDAPPRHALRPYQREALDAIAHALQRGVRRQLLVAPTGSGKTAIAASLPALLGDGRMIYIAHRLELLEQTLAEFSRWRPDRMAGIERGDTHPSPLDVTVVATVQSLSRPDRLARYRPEDWPLMIADEAHRSPTPSFVTVFRHFRHLPHEGAPQRGDGLLLGMTGTARRTDNVGLDAVYEEVVFTRTLRDMIEGGYLVPLRGYLLRGGADLDDVRVRWDDGERDFDPESLARAVNTPERNQLVVDGTRHIALREGRPTLVFAASIDHSDALAALFQRAGVRAASIHGEMPLDRRRAILDAFRRGELQVIVNCQLLIEGVDIPQVSAIVMARPTQSSLLYQQSIGRATRPHPASGKRDAIVIDIVDNTSRHASSLMSLPQLFGLPPMFDLKGRAAHETARRLEDAAAAIPGGVAHEVASRIQSPDDIPRLFYEVDLLAIAGLPPHLARLTRFAWQRMPDGALAITIPRPRDQAPVRDGALTLPPQRQGGDGGAILEVAENAIGHYEIRLRRGPQPPSKIAEIPSLEDALKTADRHILTSYRDRLVLLSKDAAWRREPATEAQIKTLERLRQPIPRDASGQVALTKGQATLMIERALVLKRRSSPPPQESEPATPKQIRYLRALGFHIPPSLTKREASSLIAKAKGGRP